MNTTTINSLWTYLQSLSLSNRNKQWLAEKLIESTKANVANYTIEEIDQHLAESEEDFAYGNVMSMEEADKDMEEFIKSLS